MARGTWRVARLVARGTKGASALVAVVREATERFKNVAVAEDEDYSLQFGCVSGPPNGGRKLIGADFLVLADAWNAKHSAPPELMGQLFHLFEAPNRFGLPAFYTLHIWAWKENPTGTFVNWHANVSCDAFAGKQN